MLTRPDRTRQPARENRTDKSRNGMGVCDAACSARYPRPTQPGPIFMEEETL
jgi:hypothetical protein